MRRYLLAAAALLAVPTIASAQGATADGSPAFGFEPYFAVGGGYHDFDSSLKGQPNSLSYNGGRGWVIDGALGANIPLGGFFVGGEGNVSKGFDDIRLEYGATGNFGVRVGDSGMIFGRAGYRWIEGKRSRGFGDEHGTIAGIGVEVGPKNIGLGGITGNSGVRLRFIADTYKFRSIRPSAALVFHF